MAEEDATERCGSCNGDGRVCIDCGRPEGRCDCEAPEIVDCAECGASGVSTTELNEPDTGDPEDDGPDELDELLEQDGL